MDSGEQMVKCSKSQIRRLKTALRWKMPAEQRQRIQIVLLRESGMTQPAIATAMGVSLSTVNRAHMAYDHGGIKALKPKPIGGRMRENMTLAEEKDETSNSTVFNLLARHGWRQLMPRPFHPKRRLAAPHDFKKTAFHALS